MYPDTKIIPLELLIRCLFGKDKIMGQRLQGRVAINRSGRGIGLGIAKKLSRKGLR